MSSIPDDLRYTSDHEWVRTLGNGAVRVGITDYAQGELGDIVFLSLPTVGTKLNQRDVFGTVEAVKAVSELYSPVGGEVTAINPALDADPAAVNRDAYDEGWLIEIKVADPGQVAGLLDAAAYKAQIGE